MSFTVTATMEGSAASTLPALILRPTPVGELMLRCAEAVRQFSFLPPLVESARTAEGLRQYLVEHLHPALMGKTPDEQAKLFEIEDLFTNVLGRLPKASDPRGALLSWIEKFTPHVNEEGRVFLQAYADRIAGQDVSDEADSLAYILREFLRPLLKLRPENPTFLALERELLDLMARLLPPETNLQTWLAGCDAIAEEFEAFDQAVGSLESELETRIQKIDGQAEAAEAAIADQFNREKSALLALSRYKSSLSKEASQRVEEILAELDLLVPEVEEGIAELGPQGSITTRIEQLKAEAARLGLKSEQIAELMRGK